MIERRCAARIMCGRARGRVFTDSSVEQEGRGDVSRRPTRSWHRGQTWVLPQSGRVWGGMGMENSRRCRGEKQPSRAGEDAASGLELSDENFDNESLQQVSGLALTARSTVELVADAMLLVVVAAPSSRVVAIERRSKGVTRSGVQPRTGQPGANIGAKPKGKRGATLVI